MRRFWVKRTIEAPPEAVWHLLVDPEQWPAWGPSVRQASVRGGRLQAGATGVVETVVGIRLPFRVTRFVDGEEWGWDVAGVGATAHRVERLGRHRCRASFGVPWPAAPYAAVCYVALRRIDELATS